MVVRLFMTISLLSINRLSGTGSKGLQGGGQGEPRASRAPLNIDGCLTLARSILRWEIMSFELHGPELELPSNYHVTSWVL